MTEAHRTRPVRLFVLGATLALVLGLLASAPSGAKVRPEPEFPETTAGYVINKINGDQPGQAASHATAGVRQAMSAWRRKSHKWTFGRITGCPPRGDYNVCPTTLNYNGKQKFRIFLRVKGTTANDVVDKFTKGAKIPDRSTSAPSRRIPCCKDETLNAKLSAGYLVNAVNGNRPKDAAKVATAGVRDAMFGWRKKSAKWTFGGVGSCRLTADYAFCPTTLNYGGKQKFKVTLRLVGRTDQPDLVNKFTKGAAL